MFTQLYNKCLKLAAHKNSNHFLAIVSFLESSFFPIPPDIMIAPMVIAKKNDFIKIFLIATFFSVLGGVIGYILGAYFFDFAINNKPCLYLNYNPSKDIRWNTNTIYNFQHFRSMKGLNAVGWINGRDQMLKTVLKTLKTPNEIAPDRKKWMETIVLHPLDTNSQNIASAIL